MNQKSFLKFISVSMLALAVGTTSVLANEEKAEEKAEEKTATKTVAPDPAKGEALYTNGDATRNIIACVSCHGPAGNSTIAQNPKLAGQFEAYLVKQLVDFGGPDRNNPLMTSIAKTLTPDDIKNVSAYLSAQPPKPGAARNKDLMELGKKIYRGGIASVSVPACASCHGPNGSGVPILFPRIAGQHQDYTIAQLTNFRAKARVNPMMTTVTHRMTDQEIKAVADYVAGLK